MSRLQPWFLLLLLREVCTAPPSNVSASVGGICDTLYNTQCYGSDITNIGKVTTHDACCAACQQQSRCNAWTWNWQYGGDCYLKTDCNDQRSGSPYQSGIGSSPSPPAPPAPPPSPSPPGPLPPTPSPAPGLYMNPRNIQPLPKRSDNYFFLLGDWGAPDYKTGHCQERIAQMMKDYVSRQQGKKLLFVGALGDNFYGKGLKDDAHFQKQWADKYGTLTSVPWLAVLGNHDLGNDDWACGCNKGCKQFNGAHRPAGTDNFWMPGYYWSYYIPVVDVEVIGIDTNALDVKGLGGGGWDGSGTTTYKNCGGYNSVSSFLNQMKDQGEQFLDSRASNTTAKTALIMQHYNAPNNPGKLYLDRFQRGNVGGTKVLSAFGHKHDQECKQGGNSHCEVILSGGGGGYIDGQSQNLGFVAVHLTDDGGFETVMLNSETSVSKYSCGRWLDADVEEKGGEGDATQFV